jgi:MFS family permease
MGDIITKENGFVTAAASDWTLAQSCLPLSIVFVFLGGSAAALGPWQARVGHRTSLLAAATCFGGGLALGSAGIYAHSLPLLYTGYGALAGLGLGLSYTPCIAALMQWFPDKKGTASGITIAGFGSGALLFTPLVQHLTQHFARMPEYLGPAADFSLRSVGGRLFADLDSGAVEVVEALASDIGKLSHSALPEGLYVVGSGGTGAAEALGVCAAGELSLCTRYTIIPL